MPRKKRQAAGGLVYHVINRSAGRVRLFSRDKDYSSFELILSQALEKRPMRLLNYCVMPNHWHLVLWPEHDGQLSQFMFWLTMTHVQRWRHAKDLVGHGPLYQGRFKSFAVETDEHYLTVARYTERNALRAKLVERVQDWRWSSLSLRQTGPEAGRPVLTPWPVDEPTDWIDICNQPQTAAEEEAVRLHDRSGRPFGSPAWTQKANVLLGFEQNPRGRGRPRKIIESE